MPAEVCDQLMDRPVQDVCWRMFKGLVFIGLDETCVYTKKHNTNPRVNGRPPRDTPKACSPNCQSKVQREIYPESPVLARARPSRCHRAQWIEMTKRGELLLGCTLGATTCCRLLLGTLLKCMRGTPLATTATGQVHPCPASLEERVPGMCRDMNFVALVCPGGPSPAHAPLSRCNGDCVAPFVKPCQGARTEKCRRSLERGGSEQLSCTMQGLAIFSRGPQLETATGQPRPCTAATKLETVRARERSDTRPSSFFCDLQQAKSFAAATWGPLRAWQPARVARPPTPPFASTSLVRFAQGPRSCKRAGAKRICRTSSIDFMAVPSWVLGHLLSRLTPKIRR